MLQKHLPSSASNFCPYVRIYGLSNSFLQLNERILLEQYLQSYWTTNSPSHKRMSKEPC